MDLGFVDCSGIGGNVVVSSDQANQQLPHGYALDSITTGVTQLGVDFEVCRSIALDNQTVRKDVTLGEVQIPVIPPANVTAPGSNLYVAEFIVSDSALLERLTQSGFSCRLGTFSFANDGKTFTGTVKGEGFQYSITETGNSDPNGVPDKSAYRLHHFSNGHPFWLNETRSGPTSQTSTGGYLQAQGGILGLLAPTNGILAFGANPSLNLSIHLTRPE